MSLGGWVSQHVENDDFFMSTCQQLSPGGELNGKIGWFPEAYVERADAAPAQASDPAAAAPVAAESTAVKARVLHDFSARGESELTLTRGQLVEVTSQADTNWWVGKTDAGESGYFPSNHVTIEAVDEPRGSTPTEAPEFVGEPPSKTEDQPMANGGVCHDLLPCVQMFVFLSRRCFQMLRKRVWLFLPTALKSQAI